MLLIFASVSNGTAKLFQKYPLGFVKLQPMNSINVLIQQELAKLESAARLAMQRVRQAKTIRQVVSAQNVTVRAELRSLCHLAPTLRRLKHAANLRAEEIVRQQLKSLAAITDSDAFKAQRGPIAEDWRYLSGNFPKLSGFVKKKSARLLHACQAAAATPALSAPDADKP